MKMDKPFKGRLENVVKQRFPLSYAPNSLGYYYICTFLDHPQFAGRRGHTSYVVAEEGNMVETRNSRYEIVSRKRGTLRCP